MEEQINFQLLVSLNEEIIEIIIKGEVTKQQIDRLHTDVISVIKKNKAKAVICDISALKGRFDEFAAAYFRSRSIPREVVILPSAVVDSSADTTFSSFYETTALNVGQKLKWFKDIEKARSWLKSQFLVNMNQKPLI